MVTLAAAVGAAGCLAAAPYLAGLSSSAPDRANRRWYRPMRVTRGRLTVIAVLALALGALAGAAAGWSAVLPGDVALALGGIPLVVVDIEHRRLPSRLIYPTAIAGAVLLAGAAAASAAWGDYLRAVEGAAAAYVVFAMLAVAAPKAMGWGDVRLAAVLGGYLGYASWLSVFYGLFIGFVLGAVVVVVLLVAGHVTRKSALAFGPMLLVGTLAVLAVDRVRPLVR